MNKKAWMLRLTCLSFVLAWGISSASAANLLYTRATRFRIPFQFDATQLERSNAKEVKLYVSTNKGLSWELAEVAPLSQKHFLVRADREGEYWFNVRTLNDLKQEIDSGLPKQAELKVIVDRQQPRISLQVRESGSNQFQVSWKADDEYLDPSKLQIAFLNPTSNTWDQIPTNQESTGELQIPRLGQGDILVRVAATDLAGNKTVVEQSTGQVSTGSPSSNASLTLPSPQSAETSQAVIPGSHEMEEGSGLLLPSAQPLETSIPADNITMQIHAADHSLNQGISIQQSQSVSHSVPNRASKSGSIMISPGHNIPESALDVHNAPQVIPSTTHSTTGPDISKPKALTLPDHNSSMNSTLALPSSNGLETKRSSSGTSNFQLPHSSTTIPAQSISQRSPGTGSSAPIPTPNYDGMALPNQERRDAAQTLPNGIRMVKSTQFQIDYQIENLGPSGVGDVELFITQNNGRKWWKYGIDPDQKTPFQVRVPQDGQYGFAIRVRSGAGLMSSPPRVGEPPELIVVVDKTPPLAQLLPLQRGAGGVLDQVTLRWSVKDPNLSSAPVFLAYSTQPSGPWTPITHWMPNSGSYIWKTGNHVPSSVYLKLTARDLAGNITHVQTPKPVLLDFSKPRARFVDVQPE